MGSGRRIADVGITTVPGRVRRITSLHGASLVTVDGSAGPRDIAVPAAPDPLAAAAAAAGLWRLQWVQIHLDDPVPFARLAGTTRRPHVRDIPLSAALSLAHDGVPTFVVGDGG